MQILDVKAHYSEKTKKQIFEIKVQIPSLKIKNSLHFGIFLCEMADGKNLKTPTFNRSNHDYKLEKTLLGKECTFIVTFDKSEGQNQIGDVLRFCFGLRDFGIRWFPETFIWVDNEFKYTAEEEEVKEVESANEVIVLGVDDIVFIENKENKDQQTLSDKQKTNDEDIVKIINDKDAEIALKRSVQTLEQSNSNENSSKLVQKTTYKNKRNKQS